MQGMTGDRLVAELKTYVQAKVAGDNPGKHGTSKITPVVNSRGDRDSNRRCLC
jgi:hypothetical protein